MKKTKKKADSFLAAFGPDGFSPVDPVGYSKNRPDKIIDEREEFFRLLSHARPKYDELFGKKLIVELRVKDDLYYTTPANELGDDEPQHSNKFFAITPRDLSDLLPFAYYTECDEPDNKQPMCRPRGTVTINDSEDDLVARITNLFENLSILWPNEVSEAIQRRALEQITKKVPCHYGV